MLYRISTTLAYCYIRLSYKIEVRGRENVPKKGPFILAGNHLSNLDPPLLAALSPRKVSFLAKEELFKNKIVGLYFRSVGLLPLKRGQNDIGAVRLTLKVLKSKPLAIFPQGTRGVSLEAANNGVGFLCKKAKVPVIAARVYGTGKEAPEKVNFFNKGKIRVIFARVDTIEEGDSYEDITQKVMDKIKSL